MLPPPPSSTTKVRPLRQWRLMSSNLPPDPSSMVVGERPMGEERPPENAVFVECDNYNDAYAALNASYKEACRYDAYDVLPEKLYGQAITPPVISNNASRSNTKCYTVDPPTLDSATISYAVTGTTDTKATTEDTPIIEKSTSAQKTTISTTTNTTTTNTTNTNTTVECLPNIVNNVPIIAFPTTDLFTDLVTSHGRSGFLDRLTVADLTKMLCQCTPRINLHATAFRNNF